MTHSLSYALIKECADDRRSLNSCVLQVHHHHVTDNNRRVCNEALLRLPPQFSQDQSYSSCKTVDSHTSLGNVSLSCGLIQWSISCSPTIKHTNLFSLSPGLLLPSEGHLSAGAEVSANVTGVTTGATTAPKDH